MLCVVMTRNVVFWLVVDGLTFFVIVVEFESFGEGSLLIFIFFLIIFGKIFLKYMI